MTRKPPAPTRRQPHGGAAAIARRETRFRSRRRPFYCRRHHPGRRPAGQPLIGIAEKGYVTLDVLNAVPPRLVIPRCLRARPPSDKMSQSARRGSKRPSPPVCRSKARDVARPSKRWRSAHGYGSQSCGDLESLAARTAAVAQTASRKIRHVRGDNAHHDCASRSSTRATRKMCCPGRRMRPSIFGCFPGDTQASVIEHVRAARSPTTDLQVTPKLRQHQSAARDAHRQARIVRMLNRTMSARPFPDVIVAPGLMVAATDSRQLHADVTDTIYRFTPVRATIRKTSNDSTAPMSGSACRRLRRHDPVLPAAVGEYGRINVARMRRRFHPDRCRAMRVRRAYFERMYSVRCRVRGRMTSAKVRHGALHMKMNCDCDAAATLHRDTWPAQTFGA